MHGLSPSSSPSSPLFSPLLFLSLPPDRWDQEDEGWHPKKVIVLQAKKSVAQYTVQIHTHLLFTNSLQQQKYIPFLNYNSSVKAITFVDNHLILVLSSCLFLFFPAMVNIFGKFCHGRHVAANTRILMMTLYVDFYVGYILYIKRKLDDCISFGSLI